MMAEFFCSATEWRRNPKQNLALSYTLNGILAARLPRSRRYRNASGSIGGRAIHWEAIR